MQNKNNNRNQRKMQSKLLDKFLRIDLFGESFKLNVDSEGK